MEDPAEPTLGQILKYSAASHELSLNESNRRLDQMLERRTKLAELSTVGVLTLNGASIVAAFSALQAGSEALAKLGISSQGMAVVISFYCVGAIQAVLSVWFETALVEKACITEATRSIILSRIKGLLASERRPDTIDALESATNELIELPPQTFAQSKPSLWFRGGAGSFWLGGTGLLLASLLEAAMA